MKNLDKKIKVLEFSLESIRDNVEWIEDIVEEIKADLAKIDESKKDDKNLKPVKL